MAHHHKPNRAVEGDAYYGHGRGMPRRPDPEELELRTMRDREAVGLPARAQEDLEAGYLAGQDAVDLGVATGEIPTGTATRRTRDPFPPTRYPR
ncbi:hypothetical protein ACWCP6_24335 [Streptomyces sp. NPDC002004]